MFTLLFLLFLLNKKGDKMKQKPNERTMRKRREEKNQSRCEFMGFCAKKLAFKVTLTDIEMYVVAVVVVGGCWWWLVLIRCDSHSL